MDLCSSHCPLIASTLVPATRRKQTPEDAAIVLRDRLRQQNQDNTASRTNVTLGYPRARWSVLAFGRRAWVVATVHRCDGHPSGRYAVPRPSTATSPHGTSL